jgi:H/ACA ribonucleoprotein complex subunit 4
MALVKKQEVEDDQIIKPEAITPTLDTSNWPLLLKNWDQCKSGVLLLPAN